MRRGCSIGGASWQKKKIRAGRKAALLVTGGILGATLTKIFESKPALAASDTQKLDYIASLLEQLNTSSVAVINAIHDLALSSGGGGVVTVEVATPWKAKEPETIFNQAIRNAGVFQSDNMVDHRNSKRLVFKVESTLNQACIIQPVANLDNSFQLALPFGGPFPCPANGNIDIVLAWDDWRPYIGIQITVAIAPVSGNLRVRQAMQE